MVKIKHIQNSNQPSFLPQACRDDRSFRDLMKKIIFILLFLITILNNAIAVTISAQVDRNPVGLDETFNLFFIADESPDDDPDFSPLENDFEVINQSQSSNISIINGTYTKKIKWTLSVMARRAGTLTVPAIKFGDDASTPIRLNVKKGNQSKSTNSAEMFMELEVQPEKVWVQSQIIVTLRFLSSINLAGFSGFSELKTEGVDAVIEKLGEDKQFQTKRGNTQYLVIERRLALFPQKSGILKIPPLLAEARLSGRSSSMFDPFQRSGQIKRVRSKAKEINVLDVPSSHKARHWLPSGEIQLSDEWPEDASTYKAGEPITRTLTIMADGLTSAQLPEFKITEIKNIKQYPDKPGLQDIRKDTGIIGLRQEKIAYIPSRAGSYTLPAIKINWWNTQTGKQETARLAAKTIKVLAGDSTPATPITPDTIKPQIEQIPQKTLNQNNGSGLWFWLSLCLASGWLITLILWWRHKRNDQSTTNKHDQSEHNVSLSKAQQQLKQACQSSQPQPCKDALLEWGKAAFPAHSPNSLGQLGTLLGESLRSRLDELEASLYGSQNSPWQAGDLYQAISDWEKSRQLKTSASTHTLEPLRK
jgi:BatD DUF11 like domain